MIRARIRPVLRIVLTIFICLILASFVALQLRYGAALNGLLSLPQANAYEQTNLHDGAQLASSITTTVDYCSEVVASNNVSNPSGKTSTQVDFDNAWFERDASVYNHDLATTCSVLSAVCNSESQFYGRVDDSDPYVEKALSALGFSNIRTESYQLRSYILDQIAALFSGSHDVAAYAFASKTIPGVSGNPDQTLIFVGIRGSYGIEWVSNFRVFDQSENAEHIGFNAAEQEIVTALAQYIDDSNIDPQQSKILTTGHSRGGSIANLLAADLDRGYSLSGVPISAENVYAYTFAAPSTVKAGKRSDQTYDNIFNVVSTSDVVPQLPLSSWNYDKYGTTITLPRVNDSKFATSYTAMQGAYEANTGYTNPCNESDLGKLDELDAAAAEAAPSVESIFSFECLEFVFKTLTSIDMKSVSYAHYPDTYIAWMQSLDQPRSIMTA